MEVGVCVRGLIASVLFLQVVSGEVLTPPYFNLAEGRRITATATCGEGTEGPELFCKLVPNAEKEDTLLIQGLVCDHCDPDRPDKRHPPEFAVDGSATWWQSPPLSRGTKYNEVNLTIDLGQEFHVAYVFIKMGNSPRPGVWALERSADNGVTWQPWQYFADTVVDCENYFGHNSTLSISRDDSVTCETQYSKIVPLEGGEIVVSLLHNRPSANDFFNSTVLQEWTRATNVRLRLIRTKTLLGHLMSVARQDPTVTRRYFYSIKDISIGGRCRCNGHADNCDIIDPADPYKLICRCQHNTCGHNCEMCCPGYEQKAWSQSKEKKLFVCEPCNCFGHSEHCTYNQTVDEKHLSIDIHGKYEGGGVCHNCRDNTEGINCDKCKSGYYKPYGAKLESPDVCRECDCDVFYSTGNCEEGTGKCECRPEFTSPNCDSCSFGHFGYPDCRPCECHINSTVDFTCEPLGGTCPCKPNFAGNFCKECSPGFYKFPECIPCECIPIGSLSEVCETSDGNCTCMSNFGGRRCDQCKDGYFDFPACNYCQCDVKGTEPGICDKSTGQCLCKKGYGGARCDQCIAGYIGYPDCRPCGCSEVGSASSVCDVTGKCPCLSNFAGRTCEQCNPGFYKYPECLPCNCDSHGSIGVSCDNDGICQCASNFDGQRCDKCKEGLYNFPICEECNCNPAGVLETFGGCGTLPLGELCQCKPRVHGRVCDQCRPLYWNLNSNNPNGCDDCDCHKPGVMGEINVCDGKTGQCVCKPSVVSRRCDMCADGFYSLEEDNLFGCKECSCDIGGSVSRICNSLTGQCPCQPRIAGRTCNEPLVAHYFPTLHHNLYEVEAGVNPAGSSIRYGFNETLFPDYSWKGYAVFSYLQEEINQDITIHKPSVYRMVLRYVNLNPEPVVGKIVITPENPGDAEQNFLVSFKPSKKPTFVTVSGASGGIPSPLVMNPGLWTVSIKTGKSLLVDYFVLLPSAYYEASVLSNNVMRPCTVDGSDNLCRHFQYPTVSNYDTVRGEGGYTAYGDERRPIYEFIDNVKQLHGSNTSRVPAISANQPELRLDLRVTRPGPHVLVFNYVTPENAHTKHLDLDVKTQNSQERGRVVLYPCTYTSVCRQVAIDRSDKVGIFNFDTNSISLTLKGGSPSTTGIESVVAIPLENWSLDFIQPKPACVQLDGKCIESSYRFPPESKKIEFELGNEERTSTVLPPGIHDKSTGLIYLDHVDPMVDVKGKVPFPGHYVFVVHYYQPHYPEFDMDVLLQNGQFYEGKLKVPYCPSTSGCRSVIKQADGNKIFSLTENYVLTLKEPNHKSVWLDYVLAIPVGEFQESVTEELPFDQTSNFITKCGSNHFYVDTSVEGFCKESIFSLTSDYNNGAHACHCDVEGSLTFACNAFGGQCSCKPNVIGRRCDACKNGYYGFPNCIPCRCPLRAQCDPVTGECKCPDRVAGQNCDKCEPETFGFDLMFGCELCDCNSLGVKNGNLQCDINNGTCDCLANVVGRKCDRCQSGHWAFPHCQPCECDLRGTEAEVCDQKTSDCYCKENVHGQACDLCKEGAFNIQEINPDGCTKCFCFGRTTRCSSSSLYRTKINGMHDWTLATVNITKSVLVEPVYAFIDKMEDAVLVDLSDGFASGKVAYFVAPEYYLDNRLTSFGGVLNYSIFGTTKPGAIPVSSAADVILHGANLHILHYAVDHPTINLYHTTELELFESNFVLPNGMQATREQLMQVLEDLRGIYIRATYWTESVTTRLISVSLDSASTAYSLGAEIALGVEQCHCPPNYEGLSCEKCADGYYRAQTGPYGGYCIPCQCNGHATTCDKVTGICLDCKHNTTGDHCELCSQGYHGNATFGAPYDCLICACPLPIPSNNFATGCDVSPDGEEISCQCTEGYYGALCESCANGYYGRPRIPGEYCKPCQCSGNINPEEPGSCDSITGECIKCLNNTSGVMCQYCAPGFYGDAIALKNCQSCDCDKCGVDKCDHSTGLCQCRENVVGEKCDRCLENYYGFSTCAGCRACDCQLASESLQCEDSSGQCRCKPGVTGRNCDRCASGFWDYGPGGCLSCGCNTDYSVGVGCNPNTGQCECLPGVIGDKCSHCPHRWVLDPDRGCFECDTCTHSLLDTTDELRTRLHPIIDEFNSVAATYFTTQRLSFISGTVDQLAPNVTLMNSNQVDLSPLKAQIDSVSEDTRSLNRGAKKAVEDSSNTPGATLLKEAIAVEALISNAQINSQLTVEDVSDLVYNLEHAAGPRIDDALNEAKFILENINASKSTIGSLDDEAGIGLQKAKELHEQMKEFSAPVTNISVALNEIRQRIKNFDNRLEDIKNHSMSAQRKAFEAGALNVKNRQALLNNRISGLNSFSNVTSHNFDRAKQLLANASKNYNDADRAFEVLNKERARLNSAMENLEPLVSEEKQNEFQAVKSEVERAKDYADQLEYQAKQLEQLLKSTINQSGGAVEAANAYTNMADAIQEALNASTEADKAAQTANDLSNGLGSTTIETSSQSLRLSDAAQDSLRKVRQELEPAMRNAMENVKFIEALNGQAAIADEKINKELEPLLMKSIKDNLEETGREAEEIDRSASKIVNDIDPIVRAIPKTHDESEKLYRDRGNTKTAVHSAGVELDKVNSVLPNLTSLTEQLQSRPADLSKLRDSIKSSIDQLKEKIALTRDITNRIGLGVTFQRNSTLELKNPDNLAQQGLNSQVSIYFKTAEPNGLIFYLGNEMGTSRSSRSVNANRRMRSKTDDFMALEIVNGYPTLTIDLGSGVSTVVNDRKVSDNHWYQAVIERVGKSVKFTIREDLGKKKNWAVKETVKEAVLEGSSVILNLDKDHSNLFVGGYPPTFEIQPDVKYSSFQGEMEEFVIGDTQVGLWNFVDAIELQGAYERNELATKSSLTSVRLGGEGYITIDSRSYIMRERAHIGFKFKSAAKEGLMFLAFKDTTNFLSIELREGRVLYQYNLGDGLLTLASDKTFNDDEWHSLEASRYHKDGVLKIDGDVVTKNQSPGFSDNLEVSEDIFVGGYPGFHKIPDVTEMDFDGCLDELQIDSTGVDMVSSIKNAHDMKQGCPKKFSGIISFDARARSYAKIPSVKAADLVIQIILRLKTLTSDGLIAFATDGPASAVLRMEHGVLLFQSGHAQVQTSSEINYADGQWHVVVATHDQTQLTLDIDDYDKFVSDTQPKPIRLLHPNVYLGGVSSSEDAAAAISPQFNGCIGDATVNGDVINFSELTEAPGTTIGKCVLETPIFFIPKPPPPPPTVQKPEEKPEDRRPPAPPLITDSEEILEPDEVSDSPDVEDVTKLPDEFEIIEDVNTAVTPTPLPGCSLPLYPAKDAAAIASKSGWRFGTKKNSRLEFKGIGNQLNKNRHKFSIDVKTIAPDGLIFYISDKLHVDFIALYMKDGFIFYGFNCGSGPAILTSEMPINNGEWHTISFSRNGTAGKLQIDHKLVATNSSVTGAKSINVNDQTLYIGSADPNIADQTKMNNNLKGMNNTFEGCLRNLRRGENPFGEPDNAFGVIPCSENVESGVFFSADGGYLKGKQNYKVGVDLNVKLHMKPRNLNGLLFSVHGKKDYLVLQMLNGTIRFSVENGKGETFAAFIPPVPHYFCDGQWHTIEAVKTKTVVTLSVDKSDTVEFGRGPSSTDTSMPIFIGGHPNPKSLHGVLTTEQFVGCLNYIEVNNKGETYNAFSGVGNVTLSVCPLI